MRRLVWALLAVAAMGCDATIDDEGSDGGRPSGIDARVETPDGSTSAGEDARVASDGAASDGAASDGATSGSDAGGALAALCRIGCESPADCATPSVALYDASHYACEASVCRWTGCATDDECRAALGRSSYACRSVGGLRQCVLTCSAPADCASASAAFDADNYACTAGVCEYTGCRDDAECASSFSDARYVCRRAMPPDTGLPVPTAERNCVLGCATESDCSTASAAFDADNYACLEGACVYRGCNSDAECRATFAMDRYVCR